MANPFWGYVPLGVCETSPALYSLCFSRTLGPKGRPRSTTGGRCCRIEIRILDERRAGLRRLPWYSSGTRMGGEERDRHSQRSGAIEMAQALRRDGIPDTAIAARLGVDRNTVVRWLGPRRRSRHDHAALIAAAFEEVQHGSTISQVARSLGISRSSLQNQLTAAGIKPARRPAFSDETITDGLHRRAAGQSDRAIATALGVSRRRVVQMLGHRTRRQALDDRWRVREATCVTLFQLGLTQRQVAVRLCIDRATVGRALAEARADGIPLEPRQKVMLPQYRRLWSDDDLIAKAQEWGTIYDRQPAAPEWNPWHTHNRDAAVGVDRIERFYQGTWPFVDSVIGSKHHRPWGSPWNRFLETAGFTPLPQGYHFVADDDGHAIRIDGRRLIRHNARHDVEYLEGDAPPHTRRKRR
jgi:DNA-binding phage protein